MFISILSRFKTNQNLFYALESRLIVSTKKSSPCWNICHWLSFRASGRNAGFNHLFKFLDLPTQYIIRVVEVRLSSCSGTRRKFKVPAAPAGLKLKLNCTGWVRPTFSYSFNGNGSIYCMHLYIA